MKNLIIGIILTVTTISCAPLTLEQRENMAILGAAMLNTSYNYQQQQDAQNLQIYLYQQQQINRMNSIQLQQQQNQMVQQYFLGMYNR